GPADQKNAMVPFFLSISLIIKCSADEHDDIAHLLRCLRRLKDPWGDVEEEGRHVVLPKPNRAADRNTNDQRTQAEADPQNRINQLAKKVNELALDPGSPIEPEVSANKRTKVADMPDVDVLVSERTRIIGVSGTTMFEIQLANFGAKPATNLVLTADLSSN